MHLEIQDIKTKFTLISKNPKPANKVIITPHAGSTSKRTHFSEICPNGSKAAIPCVSESGEPIYAREFEVSDFEDDICWGVGISYTKGYINTKSGIFELERELTPRLFARCIIEASLIFNAKHGARTISEGEALLLAFDRTRNGDTVYIYRSCGDTANISTHFINNRHKTNYKDTRKLIIELHKISMTAPDSTNYFNSKHFNGILGDGQPLPKKAELDHREMFRKMLKTLISPVDMNPDFSKKVRERKEPFFFGGYDLTQGDMVEFDLMLRGYRNAEIVHYSE